MSSLCPRNLLADYLHVELDTFLIKLHTFQVKLDTLKETLGYPKAFEIKPNVSQPSFFYIKPDTLQKGQNTFSEPFKYDYLKILIHLPKTHSLKFYKFLIGLRKNNGLEFVFKSRKAVISQGQKIRLCQVLDQDVAISIRLAAKFLFSWTFTL